MKHLLLYSTLFLIVSCSPGGPDATRAELERVKIKAERYNQLVTDLEKELEQSNPQVKEENALLVEVKGIKPEPFDRFFEVNGYMEALEDAFISPEISGQIEEIKVIRGARVKKGTLMLKLNTDLNEKSIEEVRTNLELAERLFEKQEELWKKNIGSEIQYLEAKNAKESLEARLATLQMQLEMAHINAPFDGIIDDIMVKEGELASPGLRLIRLVNLDVMRVSARVSEAYMDRVKQGDQVELSFASLPDLVIREKITRLGQVIDSETRTFPLEVTVNNRKEQLKPNMLTSVRIKDFSEAKALVVPSIVLKQDFKGTFLFLADESGESPVARKVYVTPGITVQDRTMIKNGIVEGQQVIINGYNLVNEGTPLRVRTI